MSVSYITVHGYEFVVDTSDWSSEEGREIAEHVIEARLSELTPEQAAELHAELRKFDDGDSFSLPPLAREISREAFRAGTHGWACVPDSGHNTEIGAYPDPDDNLQERNMNKTMILAAIRGATSHADLSAIVEAYLAEISESEQARSESYAETAARLGGDEILNAAEQRWFELV